MKETNLYKNKKAALLLLIPAFTFLIVYLYYPFLQNIISSFYNINELGSGIGERNTPWYANYIALFTDRNVRTAIGNTLLVTAVALLLQVGMGLVLALLVDSTRIGAGFFRTVYFFPVVITATALALLFNMIFLYDNGMANQLLQLLGREEQIDWKSRELAMVTLLIPVIWQYVGFYFVILTTGISGIPKELYEAASLDGAGKRDKIRYITLPLLKNILESVLVLGIMGSLKVFDIPWLMFPKGMPVKSTFLVSTYMYYQTMEIKNIDYGCTLAVLIVVMGLALSKLPALCMKSREERTPVRAEGSNT